MRLSVFNVCMCVRKGLSRVPTVLLLPYLLAVFQLYCYFQIYWSCSNCIVTSRFIGRVPTVSLRPDLLAVFQLYCYFQHLLAVFQLLLLPGLLGLRLRCFNITFQLYRGGQFYWVEGSCLIYAICVCWRIMMSNAYCVVFFSRLVYLMFASFSGLSILIAPSIFSNVY